MTKFKIPKKEKHLVDLIEGAINSNNIEKLTFYINFLVKNKKYYNYQSIINNSLRFSIVNTNDNAFNVIKCYNDENFFQSTNLPWLFVQCKANNIKNVYNFIEKHFDISTYKKEINNIILNRLLLPNKVAKDFNRLDYLDDIINSKIISNDEVDLFYKKKLTSSQKEVYDKTLKVILRERNLKKLLD